jgi:hypothetical protein
MDTQTLAAFGVPAIVAVVWLIRLEGRVNTQDARYQDLRDDLKYIRERIDRALNGHDA